MTSDRTMIVNLMRLIRRQNREIDQLKDAFLSLAWVLADRDPALVAEMQAKLPEVIALEKAELPQEAEADEQWDAWLQLREQETITGKEAPTQ